MSTNKENKVKEKSTYQHSGETALSNRAFTIPNLICLIRILLITPFVEFFLDKEYVWAAVVIILSGLSDCFDGLIARKFNQESELGKILDPLADKLTLLAVGVCLCLIEPFFLPVVIILVVKDVLMLIGSTKVVKMGILVPKSKWYGKVGTVMFYVTVTFIVFVEIMQTMEKPLVNIDYETGKWISMVMLCLTAVMMIFAFIMYTFTFRDIIKKAQASQESSASITE
ncbi:MAG: CDP-alcohol phosphatidyltransferase family protein [Ruminococcus sp.]|nr:CDP-alcohol phosphatidyltransferase family protein [Ruminococcus sp.]MBQ7133252.1 CDP-alcohol phosphatidyltransferase family protein [Ruminococcus sp.]